MGAWLEIASSAWALASASAAVDPQAVLTISTSIWVTAEDEELKTHLHQAIDALPPGYRLLITLRHLQAMSYTEIAQATGLPLGTVKTGIFRARAQLRTALQDYEVSDA
jgi:RNA polymerase sigma factor (sigma-70 family)